MLFFLTGDIQTGKTRWLERVLDDVRTRGVEVAGVLAPGVWRDHGPDAPVRFEKLGIDNVLLPSGDVVPFARRADLASADGSLDVTSQAARAQLAWAIDDTAIERVNGHFERLAHRADDSKAAPALLVVDELGRLELLRGEGLVSAMRLLDAGATPAFPHALAIVREGLLDEAQAHFSAVPWSGMRVIHADDEGRDALLNAFLQKTE